jgi:hypothetical protein
VSDHKCPKCGGGLTDQTILAYSCNECGTMWSAQFVDGYWTRDREEKAKRCDGCKSWLPDRWRDYDQQSMCAIDGFMHKRGYRCKFWGANERPD